LRWPGYAMIALALVQSLLAAFVAVVATLSAGVMSRRNFAVMALVMAGGSSLPAFTSFALPDIFAGVLVVSQLLLFGFYERLSLGLRIVLVAIAAFAVAAHASVLPLALWLCLAGSAIVLWRKTEAHRMRRAAWLSACLVIGA